MTKDLVGLGAFQDPISDTSGPKGSCSDSIRILPPLRILSVDLCEWDIPEVWEYFSEDSPTWEESASLHPPFFSSFFGDRALELNHPNSQRQGTALCTPQKRHLQHTKQSQLNRHLMLVRHTL